MTSALTSLPGTSFSQTATAASTAAGTASSTVARTSDPTLPAQAVQLSSDAGVIASLGTGSSSAYVYDAAGLLGAIDGAGQLATPLTVQQGSDVGYVAQALTDSGVVGTLATDTASSGIYTASGGLQSLTASGSNWASALKSDPALAGVAVGDAFAQGVLGTINTTA